LHLKVNAYQGLASRVKEENLPIGAFAYRCFPAISCSENRGDSCRSCPLPILPLPFNLPRRLPSANLQCAGHNDGQGPYCEVYKAVFACAEAQAGEILRARAAPIVSLRERHEAVVSSTE